MSIVADKVGDVVANYISKHAADVIRLVNEGKCVLLDGPLGAGKSLVLDRVTARLEQQHTARVVRLDAAQAGAAGNSAVLLRAILAGLQAEIGRASCRERV